MILNMNSVEWARKCVQMVNKRKTTGETNQMETDDPEKEISKYSLHNTQQTLRKLQVEVRYCLNKLGHAWPRAGIEWKTTWNSKGPWEFNLCDQSSLVLTLWRSKSLLHYISSGTMPCFRSMLSCILLWKHLNSVVRLLYLWIVAF